LAAQEDGEASRRTENPIGYGRTTQGSETS
jgi:hypothetical protein